MRVVLAEKPSVAREIAAFLGANMRREGYLEGRGYQVTWALGHLATLKEPQDYDPALKKWSLATLPFVPDHFGLKLFVAHFRNIGWFVSDAAAVLNRLRGFAETSIEQRANRGQAASRVLVVSDGELVQPVDVDLAVWPPRWRMYSASASPLRGRP